MENNFLKLIVLIFILIFPGKSAHAKPIVVGTEIDQVVNEPMMDIVGELRERPSAPRRSSKCDDGGCNSNKDNNKDSLKPRIYLCIGISCGQGNAGQAKGPSIVRTQDGKVVEQLSITVGEELKELASNELSNQITKETLIESSSSGPKNIRTRAGIGLHEEAVQLGSLLGNAKNQSSEGNEKNELGEVMEVTSEYIRDQFRFTEKISNKLKILEKEKESNKVSTDDYKVSQQKSPANLPPVPPAGKSASEKLKNISRAIFNLALAPAAVGSLYNPAKEEFKVLLRLVGDASTKLAPELVPGMLSAAASLQVIAILFESSPVGVGSDVVPQEVLPPPLDPNDEKANDLYNRAKKGDRSAKLEYLNGENEKSKVGIEKYGIKTKAGLIAYSRIHDAIKTLPGGLKVVRIREGVNPGKFAIIGRKMDVVNVVYEYLKSFVEDVEIFCPSEEARDEYKYFVKEYKRDPNHEEQLNMLTYNENKIWVERLIREGVNVIDVGNNQGVKELSSFYEMEKMILFK